MPSDPARAAKVQAWLTKVAADLRAAEHDLAADPPLLEDSLFHCQQAAEKTLKAFLTSRNISFRTERADIEVIWFGSWPKGTAKPHADVGTSPLPVPRLSRLSDWPSSAH